MGARVSAGANRPSTSSPPVGGEGRRPAIGAGRRRQLSLVGALVLVAVVAAVTCVLLPHRSTPRPAPPRAAPSLGPEQPARAPLPASPPAPPTGIRIPSIGVSAPVVPLALAADGTVPTPSNPETVGWVTASPMPGAVGPAVVVGHLDSYSGPAVFWRLGQLQEGALVAIQRADGSTVDFAVSKVAHYPADTFPDAQVYGATAAPELRLISCIGSWDVAKRQYRERIVVFGSLAP